MSFTYYTPFTIKASQITGTLSGFVVTVEAQDNRFKFGGGGHVLNASGFDLRAYASDGTTAYFYQLIRYDSSIGYIQMKVRVPSAAVGSVIRIYYGDAGLSSNDSSTSTWDSDVMAAYQFGDSATLTLTDLTANANTLTNNNAATATTGQIDGGVDLEADNVQYLSRSSWVTQPPAISIGLMARVETLGSGVVMATSSDTSVISYFIHSINSSGNLNLQVGATGTVAWTGTTTLSASTWYHLALTYDNSGGLDGYVDGTADNSNTAPNGSLGALTANLGIGCVIWDPATAPMDGKIDEVVIYSVKKTGAWMQALSNSMRVSTFLDMGAEASAAGADVILMGDGLSE